MLLKTADDKSKRLALLEDLQKSPMLDFTQKKWLKDELMRCRKGIQGENESAHYLDSYFKNSQNNAVLHDLRIVVDDEVAQIDHLIINRTGAFYLIETKNFSGNLIINEHGEFTAQYDDIQYGIPSPIEQSHRHERILTRLLLQLDIVNRTQKQPEFLHVVMLHPKAVIQRPPIKVFDSSNVMKADQFPTWHAKDADSVGIGGMFKALANVRSSETTRLWGEKLLKQHRPPDLMYLPEFMRPKAPAAPVAPGVALQPKAVTAPAPVIDPVAVEPAKKLICAHCGSKISYAEGKFCWNNTKRFGGLQYCRDHQGQVGAPNAGN